MSKGANRPQHILDESVDSFLSRRFGDTFALEFGSAGSWSLCRRFPQLSVKAAFPSLWHAEERRAILMNLDLQAISRPCIPSNSEHSSLQGFDHTGIKYSEFSIYTQVLHTAGNSINVAHALSALPLPILQDLITTPTKLAKELILENPSSTVHGGTEFSLFLPSV